MGKEKAMASFRGRPLVLSVLEVLVQVADEVVVSVAKDPSHELVHTLGDSVTIVPDLRPGMGPVGGLMASFPLAGGEYIAVAPCDAPFIDPDLFQALFERAEGRAGAVPVVNGFNEPLIAVYNRDLYLQALVEAYREGRRKPVDAYPHLDIDYVEEEELADMGIGPDVFININLPEELSRYDRA
jgi:molybdopterin-guanine dinucleotide biosynthesis protein A